MLDMFKLSNKKHAESKNDFDKKKKAQLVYLVTFAIKFVEHLNDLKNVIEIGKKIK